MFFSDNEFMFSKKVFFTLLLTVALFPSFCLISSCSQKITLNYFNSESFELNSIDSKHKNVEIKAFSLPCSDKKVGEQFSLTVTLKKNNSSKIKGGKFIFGTLSEGDFADLEKISNRPNINGDLIEAGSEKVSVSLACDSIPAGFFIQSLGNIDIIDSKIEKLKIGFDFSSKIPEFNFSSKGGIVSSEENFKKSMDLTNIKLNRNMKIVTGFSKNADSTGRTASVLGIGKEKFYVRKSNRGESSVTEIPISAITHPNNLISIIENENAISSMRLEESNKIEEKVVKSGEKKYLVSPIKIDPGLVMWWPKKNWRGNDYELFEWDRFSGVLVMDIENYAVQDDFFRRIAYYVEKAGFRGKLLSDEFLDGKHGYNAHDYRAESLAEFYERVRVTNFPINEKEVLLKKILIENGVIKEASDGKISAGKGAVISISQESPMYLRSQFIAHEGWHGIFFVDEDFRKFVEAEYEALDAGTKRYLIRYFQVTPSLNYDTDDHYLLINEFMAYMLQKPVNEIEKYFIDMASRQHSQEMAKKEADYIISNNARFFVEASAHLDEYVNRRWNLSAGRVWCCN